MLSADPAFLALKQSAAVAGLLRLRERWLGPGVLSPTRFLYHPAGDVYLVRCVCVCERGRGGGAGGGERAQLRPRVLVRALVIARL
jgi:hypothetical protein